jgi:Tfp pilus assembly protein PilX
MKTIINPKSRARGSVLVVTLTVVVVAALSVASYLALVQMQTASVTRSQSFNAAMAVTEAGIEESMAMLNSAVSTNTSNPWSFTNNLVACGWSSWNTNGSSITRTVFGSNTYTASIIVNSSNGSPQIDCVGSIQYYSIPWMFATATPFLAAAQTGNATSVARKVEVLTTGNVSTNGTGSNPLFPYGLLAKQVITFSGTTLVDSYDSTDPLYSTNGQYSAALRKAGCSVATDDTIANSISDSGNLTVYGSLYTGIGGTVNYNGVIKVGDAAWIAGNSGIQAGHMRNDMNVAIPDVAPPTGAGLTPPNNVNVGGTNYMFVLANNNQLYVSSSQISASGNNTILVSGTNVTWWMKAGMNISGGFSIVLGTGASLKLYVGNTTGTPVSFTMTGSGIINNGPTASFQYYGLPTNTGFTYSGSHSFVGTFYAPEAALTMSGGSDYYGAFVAQSITKSGNLNVHYDESLKGGAGVSAPTGAWTVSSWKEIPISQATGH